MPEAPDHREDDDCPGAEVCEHGCDQHPKPADATSGPHMGPVTYPPIRVSRPPEHHHRWAWAMRTDGATVQRCYDCGRTRA